MAITNDFTDVKELPKATIKAPDGSSVDVSYARHHVISNETFGESPFLKALQANGLWDQQSFKTNGVALAQTIGTTAGTTNATDAGQGLRDLVSSAAHTGGHSNYNAAQRKIFDAFDQEYKWLKAANNWGSFGSEKGWLAAQAKVVHGYAAMLKVELSNPSSALKLHSKDASRLSLDVTSKEMWEKFSKNLFDEKSLTFDPAITSHPAYVAGSKFAPGVHAGAGALDATPGSHSPLDISAFASSADVSQALSSQYGIQKSLPSFFTKNFIRQSMDLLKKPGTSKIVTGLAITGVVALVFKQQDAMAADLGRQVSFDEARKSLGIEVTEAGLRAMGGEIAFNTAVSMALPVGWARQVWDLLLSGEDVLGVIRLYGQLHPDNSVMIRLNKLADSIEQDPLYHSYKENTAQMKSWLAGMFSGTVNRNGAILDVVTDPARENPSSLNLGDTGGGHGLLQSGPGYAATMLARYVNRGGIEFVSPSNVVTGGTRPGNGSLNDLSAQMAALRAQIHASSGLAGDPGAGWAMPTPASGNRGVVTYQGKSYNATLYFDAQGKWIAFTPDAGQSGVIKLFNGKELQLSSTMTIIVGDNSPTSTGGVNAFGWWVEDSSYFASLLEAQPAANELPDTDPIVLDGGGDGVRIGVGQVDFDLDANGVAERLPWVSPTDPLLVMDRNGDGRIANGTELFTLTALSGDVRPALATLDSNRDGKLDAADERWSELRVWADKNQDAYASEGELSSLADLGVRSIALAPVTGAAAGQSNVKGVVATYTNGTTRTLWDIDIKPAAPTGTPAMTAYATGIAKAVLNGQAALVARSASGVRLDLNGSGATQAIGHVGNDTLVGTAGNDWLIGGEGADKFQGGAGSDLLAIDGADLQADIDGGAGIDTVLITDDSGVALNLAQANVEVVYGGYGEDVLIGGGADNYFIEGAAGDDFILGGNADDALSGQDGNDIVDGGAGDDLIRGGRGHDELYGGVGGDVIDGGAGDDVIDAGAGNDVISASAGRDTIDGGAGTDLIELSGALSDYRFVRTANGGYQITDTVADRDGTMVLTNVEKFSFRTGTATTTLDLGLQEPLPVDDRMAVAATGPVTIAVSSLLANDLDFQNLGAAQLSIHWVGDAVGGAVALSQDGKNVTFTRKTGYAGPIEFSYRVKDAQGNSAPTIVNAADPSVSAEMKARVLMVPSNAPADPDYVKQWYLGAVGAPLAWDRGHSGKGVKVLVLEPSGEFAVDRQAADLNHADLIANKSAYFKDTSVHSAHATQVAGVIGAARNSIGGVGVAYGATLDSKAFIPFSNPEATVARFREDLMTMRDYDVVNNSWVQGNPDQFGWFASLSAGDPAIMLQTQAEFAAQKAAATSGRNGLGTVMVYAAGNQRTKGFDAGLNTLTSNEYTINVGGVNEIGNVGGSNQPAKAFSERGANILVSAPASNIQTASVLVETPDGEKVGSESTQTQGTSLAAPIVSGIAALMLEANPKLTYRDVQTILALTARKDMGAVAASSTTWSNNQDKSWNGVGMHFSHDFGFGMVDAAAAVRMAETWRPSTKLPRDATMYSATVSAAAAAPVDAVGAIPGRQTLTFDIAQQGSAEQALLRLALDHGRWSDLVVTLVSPGGTRSVLLDRAGLAGGITNPAGARTLEVDLMSVHFRGENMAGTWQLIVEDAAAGEVASGTISASLQIVGSGVEELKRYVLTDDYAGGWSLAPVSGESELNMAAVSSAVRIDLTGATASQVNGKTLTVLSGIDRVVATDGNDTLTGSAGAEELLGGRGDDAIRGGDGKDRLEGGLGRDTLWGDAGKDMLLGGQGDVLFGGADADTFVIEDDGPGTTTIKDFDASGGDYLAVRSANRVSALTQALVGNGLSVTYQVTGGMRTVMLEGVKALLTSAQWGGLSATGTLRVNPVSGAVTDKNVVTVSPLPVVQRRTSYANGTGVYVTESGAYFTGLINGNASFRSSAGEVYLPKLTSIRLQGGQTVPGYQVGDQTYTLAELAQQFKVRSVSWGPQGTEGDDLMTLSAAATVAPVGLEAEWQAALAASKPEFRGYGGNDEIVGGNLAEVLDGGAGDDLLTANGGNDQLDGGNGNDTLAAGDGDDTLQGGAGDDTLDGGKGLDTLRGGAGDDILRDEVGAGAEAMLDIPGGGVRLLGASGDLYGDDGDDHLSGTGQLLGGDGNDTLIGAGTLDGGDGNDAITISGGVAKGGSGADQFILANGFRHTVIQDLEANDVLDFRGPAALSLTPSASYASDDANRFNARLEFKRSDGARVVLNTPLTFTVDQLAASDINLVASNMLFDASERPALVLTGRSLTEAADIVVQEKLGATTIDTLGGNDIVFARKKNGLSIRTGNGDDVAYVLEGGNQIDAGAGNDRIQILSGTQATTMDTLVGGAGNDVLMAGNRGATLYGDDAANTVSGDDTLIGGDGADTLYGGGGADAVDGGGGNDTLNGGSGADTLKGAAGVDTLSGGADNDTLDGGADNDSLSGDDGDDVLVGGLGDDKLFGNAGNDLLAGGTGDDALVGGAGNDTLSGGAGNNTLDGDEGNDMLSGGDYNDTLRGGAGDDTLIGGDGTNVYEGGTGNDVIIARSGIDTLRFDAASGQDTVWALSGVDTLELAGVKLSDVRFDLHHEVMGTITWGQNTISLKDYSDKTTIKFADGVSKKLGDFEPNDGIVPTDFGWVAVYDTGLVGDRTKLGVNAGSPLDDHLFGGPILASEAAYWYVVGRGGDDKLAGGTSGAILDGGTGNDKFLASNGIALIRGAWGDMGEDTLVLPTGIAPESLVFYRVPNPLQRSAYLATPEAQKAQLSEIERFMQTGNGPQASASNLLRSRSFDSFDTLRIQSLDGKMTVDVVGYFSPGAARNDVKKISFSSLLDDAGQPIVGNLAELMARQGQGRIIRTTPTPGGGTFSGMVQSSFGLNKSYETALALGSEAGEYIEGRVSYTFGAPLLNSNGTRIGPLYWGRDRLTGKDLLAVSQTVSASAYMSGGLSLPQEQRDANSTLDAIGLSDVLLGHGGNDTLWGGGAFLERQILLSPSKNSRDTMASTTRWSDPHYNSSALFDKNTSATAMPDGSDLRLRDYLNGGGGDDTYLYRKGDGGLTIMKLSDSSPFGGAAGKDRLRMEGYRRSDVRITTQADGAMVITGIDANPNANSADVIVQAGVDGVWQVDVIEFDDVTVSAKLSQVDLSTMTSLITGAPITAPLEALLPKPSGPAWSSPLPWAPRDFSALDASRVFMGSAANEVINVIDGGYVAGREGSDAIVADLTKIDFAVVQLDKGDWFKSTDLNGSAIPRVISTIIDWEMGYVDPARLRDGRLTRDSWVPVSATNEVARDIRLSYTMKATDGTEVTHHLVLADVLSQNATLFDPELAAGLGPYPGGNVTYGTQGDDILQSNNLNTMIADVVYGLGGNDRMEGDNVIDPSPLRRWNPDNRFYGGSGEDALYGYLGNDYLDGGTGNDALFGGNDNDTLLGGEGLDRVSGGLGDDTYIVDASDVPSEVIEFVSEGSDTIESAFDVDLRLYQNVENARFTGMGNGTLTGNAGNNRLTGNGANGVATRLVGLQGDDTYVVDGPELIVEAAGGGHDTIETTLSILQLATNVEDAISRGIGLQLSGNALDNALTGDDGNNALYGGAGNDQLAGGKGADSLTGESGDDILIGGGDADTYHFRRGDGRDVIRNGIEGTSTRQGTLVLGPDIARNQLWLSRSGEDLVIQILGTEDQVRVEGWFERRQAQLAQIRTSDGQSLSQVDGLVQAMAAYRSANPAFDPTAVFALPTDSSFQSSMAAAMQTPVIKTAQLALGTDGVLSVQTLSKATGGALQLSPKVELAKLGTGWSIAGSVESDMQGATDVILKGPTGYQLWRASVTGFVRDETALAGIGVGAALVGSGDLDGDGRADLVFHDTATQTMSIAYAGTMARRESFRTPTRTLFDPSSSGALKPVGVGNFSTDGRASLLIEMQGGTGSPRVMALHQSLDGSLDPSDINARFRPFQSSSSTDTAVDRNLGAGDFDGDGRSELLRWESASGRIRAAKLVVKESVNDGSVSQQFIKWEDTAVSGLLNAEQFTFRGIADYDGDSKDDIRWKTNATGAEVIWYGGQQSNAAAINAPSSDALPVVVSLSSAVPNAAVAGPKGTASSVNDIYLLDLSKPLPAFNEQANGGIDTVRAIQTLDSYPQRTYTLADNIEDFVLTAAPNARFDLIGNGLDNALTGNIQKNLLDGRGGNDVLIGGGGDDTYIVDSAGDIVKELADAGSGNDTVQSSVTYMLSENVENLTLTGVLAINGTGNAGGNVLRGNAANNILSGGAGSDRLEGGMGNDTYRLERGFGGDIVVENDAAVGNTDVALFGADIAAEQLWFRKVGDHLQISVIGSTDQLMINGWFLGSQYHVEKFRTSDGKTLLDSQVQNLVQAMAAFSPPSAGQTTLPANYQTSLAPTLAANWQ